MDSHATRSTWPPALRAVASKVTQGLSHFLNSTLRPELSVGQFTLLLACLLIFVHNAPLWSEIFRLQKSLDLHTIGFLASLAVVLVVALNLALSWITFGYLTKPLAVLLLLATSLATYFMSEYGVLIDSTMIRNVVETDPREVVELLSGKLLLYLTFFGILPALLFFRIRIRLRPLPTELLSKGLTLVVSFACIGLFSAIFYQDIAGLYRTNRHLRHLITPSNYIYGTAKYLRGSLRQTRRPFRHLGKDAVLTATPSARKKRVVVLVVGETARAQEFSLNGYQRITNPRLEQEDIVSFDQVAACGTSTATSLPCMFSSRDRDHFEVAEARSESGLLDVVAGAGLRVIWRENNSGCKGACDRIETQDASIFGTEKLCGSGECWDEALLTGLEEILTEGDDDTLIVLHQKGSHGPAYDLRYPDRFRQFVPVCSDSQLASCDRQEIVNAYDNTILYTDHVLGSLIHLLKNQGPSIETAMVYVSDHGESLGERNLYLHGLPYLIAPGEQTRVPTIVWLSPGFRESSRIDFPCLQAHRSQDLSHDHLFHSMLGLMGVQTQLYNEDLDFFASCRSANPSTTEKGSSSALLSGRDSGPGRWELSTTDWPPRPSACGTDR